MGSDLESALSGYLAVVRGSLVRPKGETTQPGNFIVLESAERKLRDLAEAAESGEAFAKLVAETAEVFSRGSSNRGSNTSKSAAQNFFRRSGLYQRAFAGEVSEDSDVYTAYADAFKRDKINLAYFALLEFISFAEKQMDFGDFQVRRFTKDELDQRLQQATCRTFYPWANVDTELLAQYWFLTCSEFKPARKIGSSGVTPDIRVRPKYSSLPEPIEEALKRLVLFPWGTSSQPLQGAVDLRTLRLWDAPVTFRVPFVFSVSDSLTDTIFAAPSTNGLSTHPEINPETGEPQGEVPFFYVHLQKEPIEPGRKTNQQFVDFVRWADTALIRASANNPFIDLAASFLVKAFFSEGLEQLLWHIIAIEAALGENREEGLTRLLKSRVGLILGDSDKEGRGYAKCFGKLYQLRCDLVHGNEALEKNSGRSDKKQVRCDIVHGNEGLEKNSARSDKKQAYQRHLGQAREISRGVVVWMLHYLDHLRSTLSPGTAMPKRAELLAALDAAPASPLLSRLPLEFPSVPEWNDL